jgi:hypothetical protein
MLKFTHISHFTIDLSCLLKRNPVKRGVVQQTLLTADCKPL